MKRKIISIVAILIIMSVQIINVNANIYYDADCGLTFTINGVTVPIQGYELGTPHDNCWEFANDIYYKIWKTYDGNDLLRNLSGDKLNITAANTARYIRASHVGANIRVEDGKGVNQHSLILVDKDAYGFTTYEGNFNGGIYFNYYTYSGFAEDFADYKYFTYIEWPNAPAYNSSLLADSGIYYTDLTVDETSLNAMIHDGKGYTISIYTSEYTSGGELYTVERKDIKLSSDNQSIQMVYNKKKADNNVRFYIWKGMVPLPTY